MVNIRTAYAIGFVFDLIDPIMRLPIPPPLHAINYKAKLDPELCPPIQCPCSNKSQNREGRRHKEHLSLRRYHRYLSMHPSPFYVYDHIYSHKIDKLS